MKQKVVARFKDGSILKGITDDFAPNRAAFTVTPVRAGREGKPVKVALEKLKAVFFVKSLEGDRNYSERKLKESSTRMGRHYLLTFTDGETLRGTSVGVNLCTNGFLLFPSDEGSNNKRVFVIKSSVKGIKEES